MSGISCDVHLNVDAFKEGFRDALNAALEECGLIAEGYAKENCPVDTGNLRNSITHQVNAEEGEMIIGSAVEYAPYIELGTGIYATEGGGRQTPWAWQDSKGDWHMTHGNRAQPFLKPAIADHMEEYNKIINAALSGDF